MSYLIILSKVSQRKEGFIVLIVFDSVNARWLVFFFILAFIVMLWLVWLIHLIQ